MSDIEKFISERKVKSPKAWSGFEEKYQQYAIGMLLAEHRKKAGVSLSELSRRIHMQKSALSRLENHGEDAQLSTIARYVEGTRMAFCLKITPQGSLIRRRRAMVELQSA